MGWVRQHGERYGPAILAIGIASLVVLTAAATTARLDLRGRAHCSFKGPSLVFGVQSTVRDPRRFLGLSEQAAARQAAADGYASRVGCRDGHTLAVTVDLRSDRVTFGVHHGQVVGYALG